MRQWTGHQQNGDRLAVSVGLGLDVVKQHLKQRSLGQRTDRVEALRLGEPESSPLPASDNHNRHLPVLQRGFTKLPGLRDQPFVLKVGHPYRRGRLGPRGHGVPVHRFFGLLVKTLQQCQIKGFQITQQRRPLVVTKFLPELNDVGLVVLLESRLHFGRDIKHGKSLSTGDDGSSEEKRNRNRSRKRVPVSTTTFADRHHGSTGQRTPLPQRAEATVHPIRAAS